MNRTKTARPSKVRPPLPVTLPHVPTLENLDEITVWLGTFRERLRIAHPKDRPKLEATMCRRPAPPPLIPSNQEMAAPADRHIPGVRDRTPRVRFRGAAIQPSDFPAVELLKAAPLGRPE